MDQIFLVFCKGLRWKYLKGNPQLKDSGEIELYAQTGEVVFSDLT